MAVGFGPVEEFHDVRMAVPVAEAPVLPGFRFGPKMGDVAGGLTVQAEFAEGRGQVGKGQEGGGHGFIDHEVGGVAVVHHAGMVGGNDFGNLGLPLTDEIEVPLMEHEGVGDAGGVQQGGGELADIGLPPGEHGFGQATARFAGA